ncbi:MAG: tol-pal system-associated acyl-CoA thioesterase [Herbaspirillum sp.]
MAQFSWTMRVYYEDTDTGGVVYYANYLKFFERARTEWLRAIGIDQQTLALVERRLFVVKHCALDYHAPARLDDELKVTISIERVGRASVQFFQQAWRLGSDPALLLTSGKVKVGCVDADHFRPAAIPALILAKIEQNRTSITS